MKLRRRAAAVVLTVATMTIWPAVAPMARAGDPVMDEVIRPIWPETAEGFTEGALDSNPELEPCPTDYPYPPTNANVVYKYFGFQGQQTPIYLDEYDPIGVAGSTPVPAIVLVHSGGWFQGCKSKESGVAHQFALRGYLVFAIDYRLACIDNDDPTPEEAPLCHWPFTRPDPDPGGPKGAAIHDVQFAVSWVRTHAATYHFFNNKVGMAGSSAGANLAFQAAGTLATGDPRRSEVVAGWSSLTELGKMTNDHYSCDDSPNTNYCWKGVLRDQNNCDIRINPACEADYTAASNRPSYLSSGAPAFIANAESELVPLQNALDFQDWLTNFVHVTNFLCEVPGSGHGQGYLFDSGCGGPPPPTVFDQTESFFHPYLWP